MIFDLIFLIIFLGALFNGYKNGFLATIIRTAFFVIGGIAGMYFVVQYNKTGWLIVAIVAGAYLAAWLGTLIAKSLKVTIIRGPLRWMDNLLGAFFESAKYVLLFYVIGTILLWAPWTPGQNSVSESKLYLQVNTYAPDLLQQIRVKVEEGIK